MRRGSSTVPASGAPALRRRVEVVSPAAARRAGSVGALRLRRLAGGPRVFGGQWPSRCDWRRRYAAASTGAGAAVARFDRGAGGPIRPLQASSSLCRPDESRRPFHVLRRDGASSAPAATLAQRARRRLQSPPEIRAPRRCRPPRPTRAAWRGDPLSDRRTCR